MFFERNAEYMLWEFDARDIRLSLATRIFNKKKRVRVIALTTAATTNTNWHALGGSIAGIIAAFKRSYQILPVHISLVFHIICQSIPAV